MTRLNASSHTAYVLVNKLALPAGAFIILIFLGHHSAALLGEYALVTTYFFIMQTLPLLGLTTFVMREVARKPEQAPVFFSSIGLLTLFSCLLINILVNLFLPYSGYSYDVINSITITGYTIIPGILAFLAETILTSLQRTRSIAYIAFFENLLRVLLSIYAIYQYGNITSLIWVLFLTRSLALLSYLLVLNKEKIYPFRVLPDLSLLKRTLKTILPFLFNAVLLLIISRLDFIILSFYEPVESIGIYAVGYRLYDICLLVMAAVLSAIFPWVAKKFIGSKQQFIISIRTLLIVLLVILWPVALAGYIAAPLYVSLLFPQQYPDAVFLTQMFMILIAFSGIDIALAAILHASDHQVKDTRALFAGGLSYFVMLLVLIPTFNIYGALLSSYIAVSVQVIFRLYYLQQVFREFIPKNQVYRIATVFLFFLCTIYISSMFSLMGQFLVFILFSLFLFPALLSSLDWFTPLRWLLFFNKRKTHHNDVKSLSGLFEFITEDLYQYRQFHKKNPGFYHKNFSFLAILLGRISRYFYLSGHKRISRLVRLINLFITKCEIDPAFFIGRGLLLFSPVGIILCSRIGSNVRIFPFVGMGKCGEKDIGSGPGCPVIGDHVTLQTGCGILGAVYIEAHSIIPPLTLIRGSGDLNKMAEQS